MVRKSNGVWRMCVDYRDLNRACPKDSYPLPSIDRLVDSTAGHGLLSFLDAYSGYNQVKMKQEDEEKTAFVTARGTYCYRVMPFGLKNAGSTFQRMIDAIFKELLGKKVEVYIDDLVVKSPNPDDHIKDLVQVFDCIDEYHLKLNPDKCVFGVESGKFLGFIVSNRDIIANLKKVEGLHQLQPPCNIKEVQHLNGCLAVLSRFCSKLAEHNLPFFTTLCKSSKFAWTPECHAAFEELKRYLSHLPTLGRPEPGEDLFLYLAVSDYATAATLVNATDQPIYFVNKALLDVRTRYAQVEKVALALVQAARRLRPYFQSHRIFVRTNFLLRQIFFRPGASGRLVKWAIELSEFDVSYVARPIVKGQALADFGAETA